MRYRLLNHAVAGEPVQPTPLLGSLTLTPEHGVALNGEALQLSLWLEVPEGLPLSLVLLAGEAPLSMPCLEAMGDISPCLLAKEPDVLLPGETARSWTWTADTAAVQRHDLRAEVRWRETVLWSGEVETALLGRRLYWGDLHAHSNLSHDGCEDSKNDCLPREQVPGADFFDQAVVQKLDFSASTEHAEYLWYAPTGESSLNLPLWDTQKERVQAAEGVVAILGYEWTYARPELEGGHKTVLLEETDPCDARHIAASNDTEEQLRENGERFYGVNGQTASSFTLLWEKLEVTAAACKGGRALTFSHHPAWTPPEMVDWTDPDNAPDPDWEPVVEIHSEHASSECWDTTAAGCDWGLSTTREHHPEGAVQTALLQGYILGFVGGTDSHDGRPGSVEDGPSCVGRWTDTDLDGLAETITCHEQSGALTGLYRPNAVLERGDVFDALFARETLVTSGPRLPVRALWIDAQGEPYLPGATVPPGDFRVLLALTADDLAAVGVELLEAVFLTPDLQELGWGDQLPLEWQGRLDVGETAYVRLHLWDPETETEHRIWLSPWFAR